MIGKMKVLRRLLLLTLALFSAGSVSYAQKHTISGYLRDASSGESLISAAVLERGGLQGTVSNNYGFYTLTLPEGNVSLECSYVGYEPVRMDFSLQRDTVINVLLVPSVEYLAGATVTASRSEIGVRGTQMSAIEIPVTQIRNIPALGGEVDVLKAIQLLPGVQSGTEGSAGLYVRGGGPDENLLLLDGVPLYNVNHMLGFFSVFNADAIKNVTLYKGSFPARFGSRLSSVVDVRMNDGNDQKIHGSASIGLIASKFNLEGPIVKGKTTFNVSARRSYYDILARPIVNWALREDPDVKAKGGYYFYDVNAKVSHKFSDRDKLFLSYYMGDDAIYVKTKENYTSNGYGGQVKYDSTNRYDVDWTWGNIVGAVRWNHVFTPKLFLNTVVNYTQYRHAIGIEVGEYEVYESRFSTGADSTTINMGYNSLINDITAAVELEYRPSPAHEVRFGAGYTFHVFRPSITSVKMKESYLLDKEYESSAIDTTFGDKSLCTGEVGVYAEDNWTVTPWLKVNLGMRYSMYRTSGRYYHSPEPRVSARMLVSDDLSFKLSYARMTQYLHLLSNSNLSLPTDLWVPVTDRVEPMRSHQVAAGVFYSLSFVDLSLEGYYKTMENVLEYRDGASFLGSTTGWEDKVALGRGWAYGVEFLAQKKVGKFTGWAGYTWSKSMRQFDREGAMINFGKVFPAKYDRRHDLSITASYAPGKKVDFAATFVYGTGICGSLALQDVLMPSYNGDRNDVSAAYQESCLEERNNYRMPPYHRLDVGVNFNRTFGNGHHRTINVSVYNAYNRNNPFLVYQGYKSNNYSYIDQDTGELVYGSESVPVLKQLSIFPILPSISYTYKF